MQTYRTVVQPKGVAPFLRPESFVFGIGSCFAETIGARLSDSGFNCCINPFGVIYNPASVERCLNRCCSSAPFTDKDIVNAGDVSFCYSAHGCFTRPSSGDCLNALNGALTASAGALKKADSLILTFGTSYVYRLTDSGEIVANCHQQPDSYFTRELLDHRAAFDLISPSLESLLDKNPNLKIVVTVSPIRHLRDDPHENQISKSHLLLLADSLTARHDRIHYFPAYEIMMDDLRDYRFYADDMVHPSPLAISYIWDAFRDWCFTDRAKEFVARAEEIKARRNHRPRNPGSAAHERFLQETEDLVEQLSRKFPDNPIS